MLEGHSGKVTGVCMTDDGCTAISCSHDRTVCVWDISDEQLSETSGSSSGSPRSKLSKGGRNGRKYHGHKGAMTAVACHTTSSLLVSACEDHSIKLWNVEDGSYRGEIRGYPALVMCLCISPDGTQLYAGARDNLIKVWSLAGLADGKTELCSRGCLLRDLVGHTDWVTSLDISGELELEGGGEGEGEGKGMGRIVASCSNDCTARLYSYRNGSCLRILKFHTGSVNAISISPDCKLVITGSSDRTAILWSTITGELLHKIEGHKNRVTAVALCGGADEDDENDDIIVTGSADGELRLWSPKGVALGLLASGLGNISKICTAADTDTNKVIVTVDMRFCVFDVRRQLCVFSSLDLAGHIRAAAITDCGKRLISGDSSSNIKVWDMAHRPRKSRRQSIMGLGAITGLGALTGTGAGLQPGN